MMFCCLSQAWAADMAAFVKRLDPNHLVMLGTIGMFGASTPALTPENPFDPADGYLLQGRHLPGRPCVPGAAPGAFPPAMTLLGTLFYQADPVCQVWGVWGVPSRLGSARDPGLCQNKMMPVAQERA